VDRQRRTNHWTEARALICRRRREYLIIKLHADPDCPWGFPGGRVGENAAPEVVLRRACLEQAGIALDTLISQPPFDYSFGPHTVTYRFFLCPVTSDEALPCGCAELRWVPAAQLAEYALDAPSEQIAARLPTLRNDR
jgi:8-oxo-dGTP pyrophosphatase MutT (NUDIX family)